MLDCFLISVNRALILVFWASKKAFCFLNPPVCWLITQIWNLKFSSCKILFALGERRAFRREAIPAAGYAYAKNRRTLRVATDFSSLDFGSKVAINLFALKPLIAGKF